MKIYITARFKYSENKEQIENLCSAVKKAGFEDYCFVRDEENYQKRFNNSHELMKIAINEIKKCDALLIDFDDPKSGRIIELGAAYALNKKIILITKNGTIIKETIIGVTDAIIEYQNTEDIIKPLSELLLKWEVK